MDAGDPLPADVSEQLRADAERRIEAAAEPDSITLTQELRVTQIFEAARAMVRAEQEELIAMRDDEGLPDTLVRPLLRQLDTRDQALRTQLG